MAGGGGSVARRFLEPLMPEERPESVRWVGGSGHFVSLGSWPTELVIHPPEPGRDTYAEGHESGPDTSQEGGRRAAVAGNWPVRKRSPAGMKKGSPPVVGILFHIGEKKIPSKPGRDTNAGPVGRDTGQDRSIGTGLIGTHPGQQASETFITKTRRHQQRQNDLLRLNLVPSWLCGEKSAGDLAECSGRDIQVGTGLNSTHSHPHERRPKRSPPRDGHPNPRVSRSCTT
jgi:hypothetical protein